VKSSMIPVRTAALVVAVMAATAIGQPTQPVWLYGSPHSEQALALVEGVDPGYCLAGWWMPLGTDHDVLIVKTDAQGAPVWAVTDGIAGSEEEAHSMVRSVDQCYVTTGWTDSYSPTRDIFVLKLDVLGNQVWGWVYDGFQAEEAYSIIETADSGYAVAGMTCSLGPAPLPNILVMKLDVLGNVQWARAYWPWNHMVDEGFSIVQTPDGGYAVAGRCHYQAGATFFNPFLMKLDAAGNVQWVRTTPAAAIGNDEAYSVAVDLAGNILVAGFTENFGTGPGNTADLFVAKFNLGGAPLWSRTFGWPNGDERVLDDRSLTATSDGGCAVCGPTTSVGTGVPNPNYLILKLDQNGLQQWCRSHPSAYDPGLAQSEVPLPMVERAGGGYAVAGWTDSYPFKLGGGTDFHLATLDAQGNRVVCVDPQVPYEAGIPWAPFDMFSEPGGFELKPMESWPVSVAFDSICFDTVGLGIRQGTDRPRGAGRELELRVLSGRVELTLARDAEVAVRAFATDGRLVATLADGCFAAGRHELSLNCRLAPGAYVVQAAAGTLSTSAKIITF